MNNPTPPWERVPMSPVSQTLTGAGTINLLAGATYLDSVTAEADPYAVVLPDGNYERQCVQIYIPSTNQDTTASFRVSGTFVGFITLLFSEVGHNAVLVWDGDAWHLIGGNALPET